MNLRVRSADVVSYDAPFSTTIIEQQSFCIVFNHRQSNPYVAALALVRDAPATMSRKSKTKFKVKWQNLNKTICKRHHVAKLTER